MKLAVMSLVLGGVTSGVVADCRYGGQTYGEGAVVCQSGYEYVCRGGSWDSLGTRCGQGSRLQGIPRQVAEFYHLDTSAMARSEATSEPHSITLRDKHWNRVKIEVRRGNSNRCEEDSLVGSWELKKGDTKVISTNGEDVCYRREADPDHPNGQWTQWTRFSGLDDATGDI